MGLWMITATTNHQNKAISRAGIDLRNNIVLDTIQELAKNNTISQEALKRILPVSKPFVSSYFNKELTSALFIHRVLIIRVICVSYNKSRKNTQTKSEREREREEQKGSKNDDY